MKAFKIIAAACFAILLIGGPTAYLLLGSGNSSVGTERVAASSGSVKDGGVGAASPIMASDCAVEGVSRYGGCYPRESFVTPTYPDERPSGVERFLLLGSTDYDDPGNATTSFLMAFFGLCALAAGVILALRRTRWMLATVLTASGAALFMAAQILWNGGESKQWVLGLAFLALNVAVLSGLGFLVFKDPQNRRRLTAGITASVIAATVLVQGAVFYSLIGTPDVDYPTYTTPGIRPMQGNIVD